jgi:hypothetical protein
MHFCCVVLHNVHHTSLFTFELVINGDIKINIECGLELVISNYSQLY